MKRQPTPLQRFLHRLQNENKSLAAWAKEQGFPLCDVYDISRGRTQGKRGQARQILIAMGVEPPQMFGVAIAAPSRKTPPHRASRKAEEALS